MPGAGRVRVYCPPDSSLPPGSTWSLPTPVSGSRAPCWRSSGSPEPFQWPTAKKRKNCSLCWNDVTLKSLHGKHVHHAEEPECMLAPEESTGGLQTGQQVFSKWNLQRRWQKYYDIKSCHGSNWNGTWSSLISCLSSQWEIPEIKWAQKASCGRFAGLNYHLSRLSSKLKDGFPKLLLNSLFKRGFTSFLQKTYIATYAF